VLFTILLVRYGNKGSMPRRDRGAAAGFHVMRRRLSCVFRGITLAGAAGGNTALMTLSA